MSAPDVVDGARSRHRSAIGWCVGDESHEGAIHMQFTTIGLDIAKNVFQVHGIDAAEKVIVRKQLRRPKYNGRLRKRSRSSSGWAWLSTPVRGDGLNGPAAMKSFEATRPLTASLPKKNAATAMAMTITGPSEKTE
jgi:hypothetical protein